MTERPGYQLGYTLQKPPSDGPDIKVVLDNGTILWIEATTTELGTPQQLVVIIDESMPKEITR